MIKMNKSGHLTVVSIAVIILMCLFISQADIFCFDHANHSLDLSNSSYTLLDFHLYVGDEPIYCPES